MCLLYVSRRSASIGASVVDLYSIASAHLSQQGQTAKCMVQVVHKEQYDEKRQVLQEATTVDDMYDMLAVYEQKVVTADQVRS